MPLPERKLVKTDLVELIRSRGEVSPPEAYELLAQQWKLTPTERNQQRSGTKLFQHEIRWARQELAIEGVIERPEASGRARWRLRVDHDAARRSTSPEVASRMIEGFLNRDTWFWIDWLPRYKQTVAAVREAMASGSIDDAVDTIWRHRDNSISDAGQGVLGAEEIERSRQFFRGLTLGIARDATPVVFDQVVAEVESRRQKGMLSKVPRLLVARAFATLAPDRYHTTVDSEKHERVIAWFEKETTFRSSPGNWAHRAAELAGYLSTIDELADSIFVRNVYPWFVFTQLCGRDGRPVFRAGHTIASLMVV